ncbi:MAG: right-handed parallel beta-helix repeat-containing protein, partial [Clostridia bacterium]|nr:right-handed parallel beta-helix repeat-containing protein [Clostridia bacterium]
FVPVSGKMLDYLTDEAEEHVLMIDLSEYGVRPSDITLGSLDSSDNVTFFMDKVRFELAQYPNDGDTLLLSNGYDDKASRAKLFLPDEALERVKNWDTSNDIRALGMLNTDYNDSTSPVTIDKEAGTVTFNSAKTNKWSQHMPFYFYNVPEELDTPGECWFDRENCILYVYPTGDTEGALLELNLGMDDTFIDGKGVDYVTFDGLTFIGSHGNGINLPDSDHLTVRNCTFNNLDGSAVLGSGYHDTIQNNEITYMGRGGIDWSGGEKSTLKKSYNLIDNNLVEHWALNKRSFVVAINGSGQGVTISHNELGHSTSNALGCSGNLNAIEYNYVHDCVKLASDCGAFYNGSSWTSGSCDIRYNIFCNIGADTNTPEAIFWDDGMAYQRAYGNLIMNVSGYGISIGGGFGNVVVNNVFLNTAWAPYLYDGRPYNGFRNNSDSFYKVGFGFIWNLYKSTPYETTVWRENFPLLSQVLQNTKDTYAPHFGYNPAFSLFSDNVCLNPKKQTAGIGVQHINYSTFIDNYVSDLAAADDVFVDPDSGDYRLKEDSPVWKTVRDFNRIPLELIGRY